ncbi:hypothetical protein FB451DRAFT_1491791 [Mycena latifolia]|nr:hypothetical protein FB451DRAFT_1491791 [Mycena latifolia]
MPRVPILRGAAPARAVTLRGRELRRPVRLSHLTFAREPQRIDFTATLPPLHISCSDATNVRAALAAPTALRWRTNIVVFGIGGRAVDSVRCRASANSRVRTERALRPLRYLRRRNAARGWRALRSGHSATSASHLFRCFRLEPHATLPATAPWNVVCPGLRAATFHMHSEASGDCPPRLTRGGVPPYACASPRAGSAIVGQRTYVSWLRVVYPAAETIPGTAHRALGWARILSLGADSSLTRASLLGCCAPMPPLPGAR